MKEESAWNKIRRLYKNEGVPSGFSTMANMGSAQQVAFVRSLMKGQREQQELDMDLADLEYVVFDLETTGFSPEYDEIISIGAVRCKGMQMIHDESFYTLVKPKKGIPPIVSDLTGISDESVQKAPSLQDAIRSFLQFIHGKILIVHGIGHDRAFLNQALWKIYRVRLSHRFLDTMIIARWLLPQENTAFDLDSLLAVYRIPVTIRHHALEDAKMTAELWSKMAAQSILRNVRTLNELYAHLSR